jgi:Fe-S-cluster containining protein
MTVRTDAPDGPGGRTPLPLVRLDAAPGLRAVVTADVRLTIGEEPVQLAITVPEGPTRVGDLLPVFRGLANVVVGVGVRNVERQGARVSCRAGCGACCRQPVPVSESEARALKRLVDAMPEPRQTQVRERFAAAVQRLAEAGLMERIQRASPGTDAQEAALEYFRLGLACPFLEDESCSIHPDRPVACREYLVTSPAEECSRPAEGRVCGVPLPAQVARAVWAVDRQTTASGCVPLVLALDWAEGHPQESPPASGPDLVRAFLSRLMEESGPPAAGRGTDGAGRR